MGHRPAVLKAAEEAGIDPDLLTTHADIFSGPYGLPDEPPYNEVVCLKDSVPQDSEEAFRWMRYLWERHQMQSDAERKG